MLVSVATCNAISVLEFERKKVFDAYMNVQQVYFSDQGKIGNLEELGFPLVEEKGWQMEEIPNGISATLLMSPEDCRRLSQWTLMAREQSGILLFSESTDDVRCSQMLKKNEEVPQKKHKSTQGNWKDVLLGSLLAVLVVLTSFLLGIRKRYKALLRKKSMPRNITDQSF